MGKGNGPSVLERAAAGDEDALEHVLGGVVAPVFDTALHGSGSVEAARTATVGALRSMAVLIRGGEIPEDTLAATVSELWPLAADQGKDVDDVLGIGALSEEDRRLSLAHLAGGVGPRFLDLAVRAPGASARLDEVLKGLGDVRALQGLLDEEGIEVSLPGGMVDEALA